MDYRNQLIRDLMGTSVHIVVDRPIGYLHGDITYPINYGYLPGVIGGDGEELDVYLLGVNEPVTEYKAKIIGIAHRENDVEDKLISAPIDMLFSKEEIERAIHFQERYYKTTIEVFK